jgi:hypothetical protein
MALSLYCASIEPRSSLARSRLGVYRSRRSYPATISLGNDARSLGADSDPVIAPSVPCARLTIRDLPVRACLPRFAWRRQAARRQETITERDFHTHIPTHIPPLFSLFSLRSLRLIKNDVRPPFIYFAQSRGDTEMCLVENMRSS